MNFLKPKKSRWHVFHSFYKCCNRYIKILFVFFIQMNWISVKMFFKGSYNSYSLIASCLIWIWSRRKTSLTSSGHNFSKCTVYFKQKYKKNKHQIFTILAWQCSLSLVILPIWCFKWGRQGISSSEVWHDHMLNVYSIDNNLLVTQLATLVFSCEFCKLFFFFFFFARY